MNADALAAEPSHVQEEFVKYRSLIGALERGLQEAVRAYLEGKPVEDLPGAPARDAPEYEWTGYFAGLGAALVESGRGAA